ncbi:L-type lectin-domain containing receptor kinase V.9-like [Macadamia integrifolia]|uniref:L-type lectin-domain containing receptor kinase V.9-like n=1 Tax=Macadamia integrifolia TaxID=60698 RepID=UPI001C4EFCAF|nr:L-type lectin-domain containing receptor kinase V.9-like [Macadamia integrifolia]
MSNHEDDLNEGDSSATLKQRFNDQTKKVAQTKEIFSKQAVQTKEILSKRAVKIANQAEEHERFINKYPDLSGHGITFVIAPTIGLPGALPSQSIGLLTLFNTTNVGNSDNHVFAVDLDTIRDFEFNYINNNHVASYFDKNGWPQNLSLVSGDSMQVWVDYDGVHKQLSLTLAPINVSKPAFPLLSLSLDLSPVMLDSMFVVFSSSNGHLTASHYVLGWSFKLNGLAEELDFTQLPTLPHQGRRHNQNPAILTVGLPIIAAALVLAMIFRIQIILKRKRKFAEVLEEWELDYGPHRFNYKDLYMATKGFKHKELLGIGGFGRLYRGVLPTSNIEVAVKKIGQLRHQNLVTVLLGIAKRKFPLVYECMPNGSLDTFLFDP